ncbi:hypothetical protein [Candidatus Synchoanobacter obligatus]|uniref:Uncharacterized protein n=1 Tax=Candidatus Synchoanobacter obligatus TaxID=2919597 RepID=A0ABT1L372_9GAMM|nr:hypothetical protein [Candidatus Synchoanobacter obligatus]MCP8351695.1 hypothetical protein [Candidatus Synchoanobacter obligatus]
MKKPRHQATTASQSNNTLYHFIQRHPGGAFRPSASSTGAGLMIHDLDLPKSKAPFSFSAKLLPAVSIIEHHISVFSNTEIKNGQTSEYHYTAILADEHHQYRLHVYFNKLDQTCCTLLSYEGKTLPIDEPAFQESAAALAYTYTTNLMSAVRSGQQHCFQDLEQQLNDQLIELEALEIVCETSQSAWLSKASSLLKHLESQSACKLFPDCFNKYISLLNSLSSSITLLNFEAPLPVDEAADEATTSESAAVSKPSTPIAVPTAQIDKLRVLSAEIKKALHTMETQLSKKTVAELIEMFSKIDGLIHSAEIIAEDETISKHAPTLSFSIFTHRQKCNMIRMTLEAKTLRSTHYKEARRISSSYFNERDLFNITRDRMANCDAEALAFVLHHYPISLSAILIKKKAPIAFYMKKAQDSPEMAKRIESCLELLVAHGYDVTLSEQDGIPHCHLIIADPSHSLRGTVLKLVTHNQKAYLAHKLTVLQGKKGKPASLAKYISFYQLPPIKTSKHEQRQLNNLHTCITDNLQIKVDPSVKEEVEQDPTIVALINEHQKLNAEYFRSVPEKTRMQLNRALKEQIEDQKISFK